jgi:hypothetical protein
LVPAFCAIGAGADCVVMAVEEGMGGWVCRIKGLPGLSCWISFTNLVKDILALDSMKGRKQSSRDPSEQV